MEKERETHLSPLGDECESVERITAPFRVDEMCATFFIICFLAKATFIKSV